MQWNLTTSSKFPLFSTISKRRLADFEAVAIFTRPTCVLLKALPDLSYTLYCFIPKQLIEQIVDSRYFRIFLISLFSQKNKTIERDCLLSNGTKKKFDTVELNDHLTRYFRNTYWHFPATFCIISDIDQ